jgi:two-component system chemotaxis response regulator CheB
LKKIRVLVVDDSALMRKIVSDMINSEPDMEVVDIARNGQELFEKLPRTSCQVITLDVEMPVMDGITALKEVKKRNSGLQVIMLSSMSNKGPQLTMECLENGAFDFIPKPSGAISLDINKVKDELVQKIRAAYDAKNHSSESKVNQAANFEVSKIKKTSELHGIETVLIGASTGGPKALYSVITNLPKNLGVPVFVVQHMPVGFTKAFADRLNSNSKITVVEAKDGEIIVKDTVYIAPGGFHMEVGSDKKIHLNSEPAVWGVRPAVDKLFLSAVRVYGSHILSVVLTGMGRDGAQGTVEVKKAGGITISEHQSTWTIYGMPKVAFETGMVDEVLPINEVADKIVKEVMGSRR